jgi:hypothetical protein
MRETGRERDVNLPQFARGLYFDLQTIEGVQPLEIWNGVRESYDPFEKALLLCNLCKIVVPLVNERCSGRPFDVHSRRVAETVAATATGLLEENGGGLLARFPDPPTGDAGQKELYRAVRDRAGALLARIDEAAPDGPAAAPLSPGPFSTGLFDFREMRVVDNEMPYIIFTDKEFRVIHGLAMVYLWLIDLEEIFLAALSAHGVEAAIVEEYRAFARKALKENPLAGQGKLMEPRQLLAHIQERLKSEDYLDLFESVYRWFEQARAKMK